MYIWLPVEFKNSLKVKPVESIILLRQYGVDETFCCMYVQKPRKCIVYVRLRTMKRLPRALTKYGVALCVSDVEWCRVALLLPIVAF